MKQGHVILILIFLNQLSCADKTDTTLQTCMGKDYKVKMEQLDNSFKIALRHNNLKDTQSYLRLMTEQGDGFFKEFKIPIDAKINDTDIDFLNSILKREDGYYNHQNRLVDCLSSCIPCRSTLTINYLKTKNAIGNISPVIMADGFLEYGDSDLNDRLVVDLILIETYLPVLDRDRRNGR